MKSIEKFRAINNMNQKELGDKLGLSRVWISNLERPGYFNIEEEYIEKMCEIFNVSKVELFGYENFRYLPENEAQALLLIKILTNFIDNEGLKEKMVDLLEWYKKYER